ncbi:DMT family protein [Klebsiella pneumoniae]
MFVGFSILYLGQKITANHLVGFALIAAGAWFIFRAPG